MTRSHWSGARWAVTPAVRAGRTLSLGDEDSVLLLLLLLLLLHHPKGPNDGEEVMLSGGNEADICDSLSGFISTQWTRGSLSARYMFDIPDVTRHVMKRDDYYYLPSVVSCVKPTQRILSQPLEQHLCGISFVEYSLTLDTVVDASAGCLL